jgi:hypothetical protein
MTNISVTVLIISVLVVLASSDNDTEGHKKGDHYELLSLQS